jgi:hypothetical protein
MEAAMGYKVKTAIDAKQAVKTAKEFYEDKLNQEQILDIAHQTCAWLIKNKNNVAHTVTLDVGPWFSFENLDFTEDKIRLDLRLSGFRKKLWGQGLRYLFLKMIEEGLLGYDAQQQIRHATSFQMMALYEELLGYSLSPNPEFNSKTINLVDLRDRFDMSPETNTSKIRNGKVILMSSFGLWTTRVDDDGFYAIKQGYIAKVFHENVFIPVFERSQDKLQGKKPLKKGDK